MFQGPCQHRAPFYGLVKRAMNRAPGPHDTWWGRHQVRAPASRRLTCCGHGSLRRVTRNCAQASCGGTYHKIQEPPGYVDRRKGKGRGKGKGNNKGKGKGAGRAKGAGPAASGGIDKFLNVQHVGTAGEGGGGAGGAAAGDTVVDGRGHRKRKRVGAS